MLVREGGKLHVYWDIYPDSGPFLLRVAAFLPKSPPERFERELRLDQVEGGCPIEGIPPHSIVRTALGRLEGESFVPLVVASVIEGQVGGASAASTVRRVRPPAPSSKSSRPRRSSDATRRPPETDRGWDSQDYRTRRLSWVGRRLGSR